MTRPAVVQGSQVMATCMMLDCLVQSLPTAGLMHSSCQPMCLEGASEHACCEAGQTDGVINWLGGIPC